MKKMTTMAFLIGLTTIFISCESGRGVYRHHHGNGPWWESRGYYRDIIIVPDKEPPVEATTLPSGPEEMPDMGAPDFGGDFGGDMGGDW